MLSNKHKFFKGETKGHQGIPEGSYDGYQSEYNETFKFYAHPGLPEGVFMRETYHTDSYGSNEKLEAVEFVEARPKTVTIYEVI